MNVVTDPLVQQLRQEASIERARTIDVQPSMARSAARADLTLLQNIALTSQVEDLSRALQEQRAAHRELLQHYAAESMKNEQQDTTVKRILRGLCRLFGFGAPTDRVPAIAAAPLADALPAQYARLGDGLRAWRQTPAIQAQRGGDSPEHVAERERARGCWQRFVTAHAEQPYLARLRPHEGKTGKLRILVLLGGGGLGDALLFSAPLAALARRLGPCEIVLCYEKPVVLHLYAGNPTVACAVAAPFGDLQEVAAASRWLGIFDLFVDVYCFLPRYLMCERSRIDMDRHIAWINGNEQLGDLIDRFSSNLGISLLDRICNTHVLDLLASVMGLPLNAASSLIFSPNCKALERYRGLRLPELYVTIRDGANPGDLALARSLGVHRTTKQLPVKQWTEIIATLHQAGLTIVQVGDSSDPPAEADIDLRGRTELSDLCFIMKHAVAHIDTEGGLVHFARAVNVPAIVFFGTTSEAFFGYPGNLNLASPLCGRCWYSNPTWLAHCPRGTEGPECLTDILLDPLDHALPALIERRRRPKPHLLEQAVFEGSPGNFPLSAQSCREWGVELAERWAAKYSRANPQPRIGIVTPTSETDTAFGMVRMTTPDNESLFGSIYNMPMNNATLDLIVCADVLAAISEPEAAIHDLLRLVGPDGILVAVLPFPATLSPDETALCGNGMGDITAIIAHASAARFRKAESGPGIIPDHGKTDPRVMAGLGPATSDIHSRKQQSRGWPASAGHDTDQSVSTWVGLCIARSGRVVAEPISCAAAV